MKRHIPITSPGHGDHPGRAFPHGPQDDLAGGGHSQYRDSLGKEPSRPAQPTGHDSGRPPRDSAVAGESVPPTRPPTAQEHVADEEAASKHEGPSKHEGASKHRPPSVDAHPPRRPDAAPDEGAGDQETGPSDPVTTPEDDGLVEQLEADQAAEALSRLSAERDEYLDDLRRLKAEFENYRRRAQRELGDADARARVTLLTEFLPILDNLDRALNAAEHHEESKVLEGVRLTHTLFSDLLRKEGVQEVEALGTHFDPTVHDALITQPSEEQEEGVVIGVLEPGYACGERVLRPAKVVVSSGPRE